MRLVRPVTPATEKVRAPYSQWLAEGGLPSYDVLGEVMLQYIEVHKIDPTFDWLEVKAADLENEQATTIRLVIGDAKEMLQGFLQRYTAKQPNAVEIPVNQRIPMEEFFEEACMARVMAGKDGERSDLVTLLPTTVIHFEYPELTSFRKSRAARVKLFLDQGFSLFQQHAFEASLARLQWVHSLDPGNEVAFELKIACLRNFKKMAECVRVFEAWIEAHPDQIEPRLGIGEMWLFLEQSQRAKDGFESILELSPNHPMALVGLAQAKLKLGEDHLPDLRKAFLVDQNYTKTMVERHLDFRSHYPQDLEPMALADIAKRYQVALKRVIERAKLGVLPSHPPETPGGLLRFSQKDLQRYDETLRCLGLEIATTKLAHPEPAKEAQQPGLFDG